MAKGVKAFASSLVQREITKIAEELRAVHVEVEVRVYQALVDVEGLALALGIYARRMAVHPQLVIPQRRAERVMLDCGEVDTRGNQPCRAGERDAGARYT